MLGFLKVASQQCERHFRASKDSFKDCAFTCKAAIIDGEIGFSADKFMPMSAVLKLIVIEYISQLLRLLV